MNYVLITPAKNEAAHINLTIGAIAAQTLPPLEWVIVSDGSTDATDKIVSAASQEYSFIHFLRKQSVPQKDFSSKVKAFNFGKDNLHETSYEYIGNIDADISFGPDYFRFILKEFMNNERLGLAGGLLHEEIDGKERPLYTSLTSVSGGVQLFRRTCFEQIGGYIPNKSGGIDSAAEIMARENGWIVRTFPEYKVLHHGPMLTGEANIYRTMFRSGFTKYKLGYHPFFHLVSCVRRLAVRPYFFGSFFFLAGFITAALKKETIILPEKTVRFLRKEQIYRLMANRFIPGLPLKYD